MHRIGGFDDDDNDFGEDPLDSAERRCLGMEASVRAQAALAALFRQGGQREAFHAARAMLETVRAEREIARAILREEQRLRASARRAP